ncbi:MAG: prepilin-type N-terminal cleavage/methylation domain-containing protein [Planctomycetota bacterium]
MRATGNRPPSAFTLIELVTVIVILAVLATVATPVFLEYRVDASNAADEGVIAALKDTANRMHLKSLAESGGENDTWPDAATLIATFDHPEFVDGYPATLPKWHYSQVTANIVIFSCPHDREARRKLWLYFNEDYSALYKAGMFLDVYPDDH